MRPRDTSRTSPAQIRAQAARAFRHRQRARQPADTLEQAVDAALARLAPQPLRYALPGETQLSEAEILHGVYHGIFDTTPSC